MRCWSAAGQSFSYDELLDARGRERAFQFLIDPDDAAFLNPDNMRHPEAMLRASTRTAKEPGSLRLHRRGLCTRDSGESRAQVRGVWNV